MVFDITFILVLFHDKKCCNFINLFPCILWDLIVMSLVLSWWRLLKTVKFATCSRLTHEWTTRERSREKHMLEFEQSFAKLYFASHSHLANSWVTCKTLCLNNFKYDSYTIYPYYIYPHYPQNCKEAIQKKAWRGFYNTYLVRESYSSSREKSLLSILLVDTPFCNLHLTSHGG